jgi:8-oxo-dGTP pyrophosphatase MutT (NUDIX family)
MKDYIKYIRKKVGHECIFLNFVGACIKNENNEILLQNRGDERGWGFLGGAIELGESFEEAIIREVKEESGYEVKIEKLIGVYGNYIDKYPNGDEAQTITVFFECSIIREGKTYDKEETKELKFVNIRDEIKMFNKQHTDVLYDIRNGRYGVYR